MSQGWHRQPYRHGLAARGVRSVQENPLSHRIVSSRKRDKGRFKVVKVPVGSEVVVTKDSSALMHQVNGYFHSQVMPKNPYRKRWFASITFNEKKTNIFFTDKRTSQVHIISIQPCGQPGKLKIAHRYKNIKHNVRAPPSDLKRYVKKWVR